jgi:5-methylcytosine-specific restriction endonuclease McrA
MAEEDNENREGEDTKPEDASSPTKRKAPPKKPRNVWIRDQFTKEWDEAMKVFCFSCVHCRQVATRSKEGKVRRISTV